MTTSALAPAKIGCVGLVVKPNAPAAAEAAARLHAHLRERGREVAIEYRVAGMLRLEGAKSVDGTTLASQSDLLVVLGGDGTLIHAAALVGQSERPVPILGINLGSLGFMTEVPLSEMLPMVDAVLAGIYRVERRIKLRVRLERDGKPVLDAEVLNDAVLNRGALARIADLECSVDGQRVTTYKADGVIVATPTGSTAYALAANGPIVVPTLEAMIIAPICPHTLTQRPLVIPDQAEVELVLVSDNGEVYLTLDGHTGLPLQRSDRLRIERSPHGIFLVKNPNIDFFGLLRAKLRWGER